MRDMSVIAGIIRFAGAPVTHGDLSKAARKLAHPGVGESAFWVKGQAGMVVRQRGVADEELAERQPYSNDRLAMIFDGRLANREDLAGALGINLNAGEVVSDGRLIFSAFERWGESALPKFIGDFAIVLWDMQNRKLLLARDHTGKRTLYYHHGSGFVAFATTYPALLALPGVPRKIDEMGVAQIIIANFFGQENTPYEGVRRVPCASSAIFDGNGKRIARYWNFDTHRQIRFSSDGEYAEAAREMLDKAIAGCLRTNSRLAAQISGGLDSSAIAASVALLLAPERLLTVTIVPPPEIQLPRAKWCYLDETPYIKDIAAMHPNMDPAFIVPRGPHWVDIDPTPFFNASGLPSTNVSNLGWFLPGQEYLAEAGIAEMLSGLFGNFFWSWDGYRSLTDMFRRGQWFRLARELSMYQYEEPGWKRKAAFLYHNVLYPIMPNILGRIYRQIKKLEPDILARICAINPLFAREINLIERSRATGWDPNFAGPISARDLRLLRLNPFENSNDLIAAGRATSGIQQLFPLMDIRLIEFMLSLPDEQFFRDGISRRLPRMSMAGRLPPSVLRNNLRGAQNPEIAIRAKALRPGMLEELESFEQVPLAARCLDLPRLKKIVRTWSGDAYECGLLLQRAIHIGRFFLWAEQELRAEN